jgi:hypothetical protein
MPQLAAVNIYDAPPSGAQPWINAQYPHLSVLVYFFINKIVARNTNIWKGMISILEKLPTFSVANHKTNTILNPKIKILGRNYIIGMRHVHNGYAGFLASHEN